MSNHREVAKQNFLRCVERGDYYEKQGNYEEALTEYVRTFNWCFVCMSIAGDPQSSGYSSAYSKVKIQVDSLFGLAALVERVVLCYKLKNESEKALFFANKQREIIEVVGRYKQALDADDLQQYEELIKGTKILESWVGNNQVSQFDSEDKLDNEPDETFKQLCLKYNKICSLEFCLLPSKVTIGNDNSCFIATAAYTTSIHPDLDTFREFRDSKLLTNTVGRLVVGLYYTLSPSLANYISRKPVIKVFVRHRLERLAMWMQNNKSIRK